MKEFCIECITCKNANYVTSKSFCGCGSETGCKYEKKTDITPWHTEPPTEEGDYVVMCSTDDEYLMVYPLDANLKPEIFHKYFKAWYGQKIEPYKKETID